MPGPAPKPGEEQRWRWFGMLLTQGDAGEESGIQADIPGATPLPN